MFEPTNYEIVIRGRAAASILRPLLDDFVRDITSEGHTRLVGEVHDASHLHGLVAHLASMNAELISIAPIDPTRPASGPDVLPPTTHHDWTIS